METPKRKDDAEKVVSFKSDSAIWLFERPVIDTKYTNKFLVGHLLARFELISHPIDYFTTLVQIGYEPVPPTISRSLLGRTALYNAGFFSYMNYIIRSDGLLGIYRGLGFNMATTIVYKFTYNNVNHWVGETRFFKRADRVKFEANAHQNLKDMSKYLMQESISRFISLGVAYPFRVLMVRSMAQFIGGENYYDSALNGLADILRNGGFSDIWAGFIPFCLSNLTCLAVEKLFMYLLTWLQNNMFDKSFELTQNAVAGQLAVMVARTLTYPFRITSTVMAVNGPSASSLAASAFTAPPHQNWVACARTLYARNEIKRGSSLFWRIQPLNTFGFQPIAPYKKPKRF